VVFFLFKVFEVRLAPPERPALYMSAARGSRLPSLQWLGGSGRTLRDMI